MKSPEKPIHCIRFADDDRDDYELFAEATKQILAAASINFFISENDLMVSLQSLRLPDILFLDLVMPLKDGYECLKEIRAQRRLSYLPVVVFSGLSLQEHVNAVYGFGANLFFKKPSDFSGYVKSLRSLFQLEWRNAATITTGQYFHNNHVTYDPLL